MVVDSGHQPSPHPVIHLIPLQEGGEENQYDKGEKTSWFLNKATLISEGGRGGRSEWKGKKEGEGKGEGEGKKEEEGKREGEGRRGKGRELVHLFLVQ